MRVTFFVVVSSLFLAINGYTQDKPNILWIAIEATSPEFIRAYGNKHAATPNIDKLAESGLLFKNTFSTGTVCSPSRTALITGVKTFKTGTGNHRTKYNVPNGKLFIEEAWNESSNTPGWWDRKGEQPFFSVFNFMESHQSRTMTNSYEWYVENVLNQLKEDERTGGNEFDMPPFYRGSEPMRKQFARVYNSLKLTDNRIGELVDRLEKENLRDNTLIFLFADLGEGILKGKTNGTDLCHRVPAIAWFPEQYKHLTGCGIPCKNVEKLVNFTDLAPTMINLAGGTVPTHIDGHNFLDDDAKSSEEFVFSSSDRSDNGIELVHSVTDGRWFYSRNYLTYMPEAKYIRYMEISEIKQLIQ